MIVKELQYTCVQAILLGTLSAHEGCTHSGVDSYILDLRDNPVSDRKTATTPVCWQSYSHLVNYEGCTHSGVDNYILDLRDNPVGSHSSYHYTSVTAVQSVDS